METKFGALTEDLSPNGTAMMDVLRFVDGEPVATGGTIEITGLPDSDPILSGTEVVVARVEGDWYVVACPVPDAME